MLKATRVDQDERAIVSIHRRRKASKCRTAMLRRERRPGRLLVALFRYHVLFALDNVDLPTDVIQGTCRGRSRR
jgi:hypothetical protein